MGSDIAIVKGVPKGASGAAALLALGGPVAEAGVTKAAGAKGQGKGFAAELARVMTPPPAAKAGEQDAPPDAADGTPLAGQAAEPALDALARGAVAASAPEAGGAVLTGAEPPVAPILAPDALSGEGAVPAEAPDAPEAALAPDEPAEAEDGERNAAQIGGDPGLAMAEALTQAMVLPVAAKAGAGAEALPDMARRAVAVRIEAAVALPGLPGTGLRSARPGPTLMAGLEHPAEAAPRPEGPEGPEGLVRRSDALAAKKPPRDASAAAEPTSAAPRLDAAQAPRHADRAHAPRTEAAADVDAQPTPPLAQAPPAPTPPAEPAKAITVLRSDLPGWEKVLTDRIEAELSQGGGEIDLTLSPEKLGPLKIRLEMADGQAVVRFVTATPEAARLLTEAQHRLSENLSRAGLDLGAQSAQSGAGGTGRNDREAPGRGGDDRGAARAQAWSAPQGRPAEIDTRPAPRHAAGRLNLMA